MEPYDAADGLGVPETYDPKLLDSSGSPSYLRKRAVYARALPDRRARRRYFLRCLGASVKAEVSVNGVAVGRHAGPFTAFACEITPALKPTGNRVEIAVDNRFDPDVQAIHADFSTYGGLYRDVILIETDPVCIDPVTDGARGVRIEADAATGRVRAFVSVLGGTNEVQEFSFPHPELWSPEHPRLYALDVRISRNGSSDAVCETFGFRTAEFRADGFYLNGVKRKLRGVNRNHPSIFVWGIFNELYNMRMPKGAAEPEMIALRDFVRRLDPSRRTVAATWNDSLKEINAVPDELGFNLYPGWYGETLGNMTNRILRALARNGRRICAVSEYGAGASVTQHADARARNPPAGPFHAEEYQAYVHSANYRAIAASDRVWGSFVWAMFDLGSDLRRESDRHGINNDLYARLGVANRTEAAAYTLREGLV